MPHARVGAPIIESVAIVASCVLVAIIFCTLCYESCQARASGGATDVAPEEDPEEDPEEPGGRPPPPLLVGTVMRLPDVSGGGLVAVFRPDQVAV